jgi:hypothetical protein
LNTKPTWVHTCIEAKAKALRACSTEPPDASDSAPVMATQPMPAVAAAVSAHPTIWMMPRIIGLASTAFSTPPMALNSPLSAWPRLLNRFLQK